MEDKKMKFKKEPKFVKVTKYVIKIYLYGSCFCKFKSTPLTEEQVDQFYAELVATSDIMEFGSFYFKKEDFNYAKVKEVTVKERV